MLDGCYEYLGEPNIQTWLGDNVYFFLIELNFEKKENFDIHSGYAGVLR